MATYELITSTSPGADDFEVFSFESLVELEDALRELVGKSIKLSSITMSFRPPPRPPFTIPEAFTLMVDVLDRCLPSETKVRCEFQSRLAAVHAERYLPGGERAPRVAQVGSVEVLIVLSDIIHVRADAIVNASNTQLKLGSGVSGAIRRASTNPDGLQSVLFAKAPVAPGAVVATDAFGLPMAHTILHAATASGRVDVVRAALRNVLAACRASALRSVAIPALGCGTGGLPYPACAAITRQEIEAYTTQRAEFPERIVVVLYDGEAFQVFTEIFGAR